jgi:hypothetical protein
MADRSLPYDRQASDNSSQDLPMLLKKSVSVALPAKAYSFDKRRPIHLSAKQESPLWRNIAADRYPRLSGRSIAPSR